MKDKDHVFIFKTDKVVRVRNVNEARRLLGRIIVNIQRGKITSEYAKTLTYLLSVYIETFSYVGKNGK